MFPQHGCKKACVNCGAGFLGRPASRACNDVCRKALRQAALRKYAEGHPETVARGQRAASARRRSMTDGERADYNARRAAWRRNNRQSENATKHRAYWKNPEKARAQRSTLAKTQRAKNGEAVRERDAKKRAACADQIARASRRYCEGLKVQRRRWWRTVRCKNCGGEAKPSPQSSRMFCSQYCLNADAALRLTDAVVANRLRLPVHLAAPLIPAKRAQILLSRELKGRNPK